MMNTSEDAWMNINIHTFWNVKQAHDFSVLTSNTEPLPNSPSLARGARHVQAQCSHRFQQLLHSGAVGPVHLHRERHIGEERLRLPHVLGTARGQDDHQAIETFQ